MSILLEGGKKGTVKWYNELKGIGFVTADVNGEITHNVLIHFTELKDAKTLTAGDTVLFDLHDGSKGLIAKQIRLFEEDYITTQEKLGRGFQLFFKSILWTLPRISSKK